PAQRRAGSGLGSSIRSANTDQECLAVTRRRRDPAAFARHTRRRIAAVILAALTVRGAASAQRGAGPAAPANFVKIDAPVIALAHARVVDGPGERPRENQT